MAMYSFEEICIRLNKLVERGFEPELSIFMYGYEYMIIAYNNHCSFQRCGVENGSDEKNYSDLQELYYAETIDNIQLQRDWKDIDDIVCFEFELS